MWHDAVLVAGKDLRIEARSRVALWQVVPFALLVLVLLAFAIGPDAAALRRAAPGVGTAVNVARRPPGSSPVTRPPAMETTRSARGTES